MVHPIYPGSFDPPTLGHLDLCHRALRLFGSLTVAVGVNPSKAGLFTVEERVEMLREGLGEAPGLEVTSFEGLLVDFCKARGHDLILRGLRTTGDFELELMMALTNARISGGIETLFMVPGPELSYASSTLIKEILRNGGEASAFLHPCVLRRFEERPR